MVRTAALARHQSRRLEQIRALGLCTDDSLSAYLAGVGVDCDRSTLVRYRAGERTAPLGLLDMILGHVELPQVVLDLWARDYGLRVISDDEDLTVDRDIADRALELAEQAGDIVRAVRAAQTADRLDPVDVERIRDAASALSRCLSKLTAAISQGGT